jgi:hypothetical protein
MDAEGSEEDMDTTDGNKADVPIPNDDRLEEDIDSEDGNDADGPIPNDDGSNVGMDAKEREEPITSDNDPEEESKSDARRAQPPQQLDGMVDWTSAEHKKRREDMLRMEWVNAQELWTKEYQCEAFYGFERLCVFGEKMERAYSQEHGNLRPGKAHKLCSQWKEIERGLLPVLRGFGQILVHLQELEAERQSGAISMGDGDKNDDDYVPRGRSGRSGRKR